MSWRRMPPERQTPMEGLTPVLESNVPGAVNLDMSPSAIAAEQVTGSVQSFASDRQVDGYIRFDTGAIMHVVSTAHSGATFSMLMPKLANATVSVSALSGTTFTGPYALAHRDGIVP